MKLVTVLVLFASVGLAIAQETPRDKSTGLFKTREDFIGNSIAFRHVSDSLNTMYLGSDDVLTIVRAGIESQIRWGTVFGFYYQGSKYRAYSSPEKLFAVSGYFKVEDEGSIYIYSQYGYLKTADTKFYFFSRGADSPIYRLNIKNLEKEFPLNQDFHNGLKKSKLSLTTKQGEHLVVNNILSRYIPK